MRLRPHALAAPPVIERSAKEVVPAARTVGEMVEAERRRGRWGDGEEESAAAKVAAEGGGGRRWRRWWRRRRAAATAAAAGGEGGGGGAEGAVWVAAGLAGRRLWRLRNHVELTCL